MSPWLIVLNVLLILNSIILIVAVLMQDGAKSGLGAIGGGAETFFGKTKARSYEGKLEMITKIGAGVFVVLTVAMTYFSARSSDTLSSLDLSGVTSPADFVSGELRKENDGTDLTLPEKTAAPVNDLTSADGTVVSDPSPLMSEGQTAASATPTAAAEPTAPPIS